MQSKSATETEEATGSSLGPNGLGLGFGWIFGLELDFGSEFRVSGLG